jgi:hypothetical protein
MLEVKPETRVSDVVGWASEGLGLRNLKHDPELTARLGLGLVGLKPGLESQNGNASIVG